MLDPLEDGGCGRAVGPVTLAGGLESEGKAGRVRVRGFFLLTPTDSLILYRCQLGVLQLNFGTNYLKLVIRHHRFRGFSPTRLTPLEMPVESIRLSALLSNLTTKSGVLTSPP